MLERKKELDQADERVKKINIELTELKTNETTNQQKIVQLETELRQLKTSETQSDQQNKKIEELTNQLSQKEVQIQSLQEKLKIYKKSNLQKLITKKEQELKEIKEDIFKRNNLDEDNQEELNDLLELQVDYLKDNLSSLEKQLNKTKKRLSKLITNEEVNLLLRIQTELVELKNQEEFETKIEIPPKSI